MAYDIKKISEIRDKVSIVEIISNFITLNKKANNFLGLCPFHDDKHASLTVNDDKKIYKCFSCNNAGDVFTFVKNYKHISYFEAVLEVAKLANLDNSIIQHLQKLSIQDNLNSANYEVNDAANKYFKLFLAEPQNKHMLDYLYKRGLNDELIQYFEVGYAPDSNVIIDLLLNKNNMVAGTKGFSEVTIKETGLCSVLNSGKMISFFKNRITFAIYNENNKIVGFSGRSLTDDGPKYINTITTKIFNKHEILYNLNHVINDPDIDTLYLVEGFMDVIAFHKLGIKNVIATMGVAFSKSHLLPLSRLVNLKNIILCFDNDEAGQGSIQKTAEIFLSSKYDVFVVQYETELKDIDEIYQQDTNLAKATVNNTVHYHRYVLNELLKQHPVLNASNKAILVQKIATVLNTYKNLYLLETDTKWIIEELKLDADAFRLLITKKPQQSDNNITKRSTNKYEVKNVDIKTIKQGKIPKIAYTELTEKEILKCCLLSSEAHELFFGRCGDLIFEKNKQALHLISNYYAVNPDQKRLTISDFTKLTEDTDMLAYLSSLAMELEQQNLEYTRTRLEKVIETHIQKLIAHKQKDLAELINNAKTPVEREKYILMNEAIQKMKK